MIDLESLVRELLDVMRSRDELTKRVNRLEAQLEEIRTELLVLKYGATIRTQPTKELKGFQK